MAALDWANTLGHLLIGAKSLSAQGDCKLVLEVMNRVPSTPTHVYSTVNFSGKNQAVETIYAGGGIYTRTDGKWSRDPVTLQEMAELGKQNVQNVELPVRDEPRLQRRGYRLDAVASGRSPTYCRHSAHAIIKGSRMSRSGCGRPSIGNILSALHVI